VGFDVSKHLRVDFIGSSTVQVLKDYIALEGVKVLTWGGVSPGYHSMLRICFTITGGRTYLLSGDNSYSVRRSDTRVSGTLSRVRTFTTQREPSCVRLKVNKVKVCSDVDRVGDVEGSIANLKPPLLVIIRSKQLGQVAISLAIYCYSSLQGTV